MKMKSKILIGILAIFLISVAVGLAVQKEPLDEPPYNVELPEKVTGNANSFEWEFQKKVPTSHVEAYWVDSNPSEILGFYRDLYGEPFAEQHYGNVHGFAYQINYDEALLIGVGQEDGRCLLAISSVNLDMF